MTRIVFMGSPEFAVPALRALANQFDLVGVVTQPDRPAGRGKTLKAPAVKSAALDLGLGVIQPEKLRLPEAMQQLRAWAPDLIVVAAFGQLLRPDVLDLPRHGCLNVHASLLPRWRGASPIQAAIAAGDAETGVTIMKMDVGLDTGGILSQRRLTIDPRDTGGTLAEKLSHVGADLLLEALPGYVEGRLTPQPQDANLATQAPMLKKHDGLLDFSETASVLERRVRAFNPWPGAYFLWQGSPLKVLRARAENGSAEVAQRLTWQDRPAIGTGESLLVLEEVQPAGKRPMSGGAFLAGAREWTTT